MNFIKACREGDLKKVKKFLNPQRKRDKKINIHARDELAFRNACEMGHNQLAKFLLKYSIKYPVDIINIHAEDEEVMRLACRDGTLELLRWLYKVSIKEELKVIDIHIQDEFAMRWACKNCHLKVIKWLYKVSKKQINIHAWNDFAFYHVCQNDDLQLAKLLYKISIEYNDKINIKKALYWALDLPKTDEWKVAKWLLTLYTEKELINVMEGIEKFLAKKELENRKKNKIILILSLYEKKYKLIDINAISLIWLKYL